MSFLGELSKLVSTEKQKQVEQTKKDVVSNKLKTRQLAERKKDAEDAKIFDKFMKDNEYGRIGDNNTEFKDIGKMTFKNCLQKAYCRNLANNDTICANNEKFYPYLAWKRLETQQTKGSCLLGTIDNDDRELNYSGKDYIPVFVTPIEDEDNIITFNLNNRENKAKNNIIGRLRGELVTTNKKLLYNKNELDINKDKEIKDNYTSLNTLDTSILDTTQRIRYNNSKYIMNDKVSNIMMVLIIAIIVIFVFVLSYYSVKYMRNIK